MRDIIFLQPVFKQMLWGGTRLRDEYGYDIPGDHTGEAWVVSAHSHGDCTVKEGPWAGKPLSWLWENQPQLFGSDGSGQFPLLVKIIDARDDLSIQVHPDEQYARAHENGASGKTECWYVLDCDPDSTIVIGHHAKDREELRRMAAEGRWRDLIRILPIKKGDFFQIEPGTVHAIRRNTLILETQQSCDITYRLYDYGRLQDGKPRELHLEKSLDVIRCPHRDAPWGGKVTEIPAYTRRRLITCPCYTVDKWDIETEAAILQDHPFLIVDVLDGQGTADGHPIRKGDHFILPCGYGICTLKGNLSLITSHI